MMISLRRSAPPSILSLVFAATVLPVPSSITGPHIAAAEEPTAPSTPTTPGGSVSTFTVNQAGDTVLVNSHDLGLGLPYPDVTFGLSSDGRYTVVTDPATGKSYYCDLFAETCIVWPTPPSNP